MATHIGKNGPAECKAPAGKCPLGGFHSDSQTAEVVFEAQMEMANPTGAYTRATIQNAPTQSDSDRAAIAAEFPGTVELKKGTYLIGDSGESGSDAIINHLANVDPDDGYELADEIAGAESDEDYAAIAENYGVSTDTVRFIADSPTYAVVGGEDEHGYDTSTQIYDMERVAKEYPGFMLDISTDQSPLVHVDSATTLHREPFDESKMDVSPSSTSKMSESDRRAATSMNQGVFLGGRSDRGGIMPGIQNMDGTLLDIHKF